MRRRGTFWLFAVVVVIAVLLLIGSGSRANRSPFDPNGVGDDGLKGVLDLARSYGASVNLIYGVPDGRHSTALLVNESYGSEQNAALLAWVRGGGTLILATPRSDLLPLRGSVRSSGEDVLPGGCSIRAIANVRSLSVPPNAQSFRTGSSSTASVSPSVKQTLI